MVLSSRWPLLLASTPVGSIKLQESPNTDSNHTVMIAIAILHRHNITLVEVFIFLLATTGC